jgi:hypothetical protein
MKRVIVAAAIVAVTACDDEGAVCDLLDGAYQVGVLRDRTSYDGCNTYMGSQWAPLTMNLNGCYAEGETLTYSRGTPPAIIHLHGVASRGRFDLEGWLEVDGSNICDITVTDAYLR